MQLVIDIPEKEYHNIQIMVKDGIGMSLYDWISKGTLLPKEHGDLVDRDSINNRYDAIYAELTSLSNQPSYKELLDKLSMCLDTAQPIINNNYE